MLWSFDAYSRSKKNAYIIENYEMQNRRTEKALQAGINGSASGNIVQFQFGEDGIDVSKSEGGKVNVTRIIESHV